ncbi:MAG: hypothetical protein KJ666_18280 [Bacteroidetes bacterium]|nr:hypothetical protein [Bacteroidota bacterium]
MGDQKEICPDGLSGFLEFPPASKLQVQRAGISSKVTGRLVTYLPLHSSSSRPPKEGKMFTPLDILSCHKIAM